MVPVPVPAYPNAASAAMTMSQSGASGWTSWEIPSCHQTFWTVWTETRGPVRLISSTLILDDERYLFPLMIRIRAWSSLGVVILNRCPCGIWIALLVSRTRRRSLEMPPCGTPVFLNIALWERPRPEKIEQWVQEFQVGYWLGWLSLCFEIAIYVQLLHKTECIRYKCDTQSFGTTIEKSALLRNELSRAGQNWRWTEIL